MLLQFLVGALVSVVNIGIHALVTVVAIWIARSAGLRKTERPRLHLMGVMMAAAAVLMVAHTLETLVWAWTYAIVEVTRSARQRSALFRLRQLHHAGLWRHHTGPCMAAYRSYDRHERRPAVRLVGRDPVRGSAQGARSSRSDRRARPEHKRWVHPRKRTIAVNATSDHSTHDRARNDRDRHRDWNKPVRQPGCEVRIGGRLASRRARDNLPRPSEIERDGPPVRGGGGHQRGDETVSIPAALHRRPDHHYRSIRSRSILDGVSRAVQ